MSTVVLLLPGWHNSSPTHWQSAWETQHGYTRVQQHNWEQPLRGDWMIQLEEAVLAHPSSVLVAHGLACALVAAWAAHSRHTARVTAAMLVSPVDVERVEMRQQLPSWNPMVRERLPFPSMLVASRDDPYCSFMRTSSLAHDWGSRLVDAGTCGHVNADSLRGDWPQGHALLLELLKNQKEETHGH